MSKSQDRWMRENSVIVSMKIMRRTEADILSKLEEQENKSAYIKALIRKDIEKES